MVAEIQKLEAAARMAMGSFEGHPVGMTSVKPRPRFFAYALLALAVAGLALALL